VLVTEENCKIKNAGTLYFILYPCWVNAQGDPCTVTISDLLGSPIYFLIIPDLSTRALWQLPAEASSSGGETL
jgi:hypothetical protein